MHILTNAATVGMRVPDSSGPEDTDSDAPQETDAASDEGQISSDDDKLTAQGATRVRAILAAEVR
jgi:hypothetical protein